MQQLIALEGVLVFHATENRQIDGVLVLGARGQSRSEHDLLSGNLIDRERIAERQLVLGQGAGLVRAEHVYARQLLDGHQAAHDRLLRGEQSRSDCHRDREHCRHCHGNRCHGEHQGELQRVEDRVTSEDRDDGNQRHQPCCEDDQESTDLQHCLLEVADGLRFLHQLCCLAEVGLRTCGVDHGPDLTLTDDRSGEHRLPTCAGGRQ